MNKEWKRDNFISIFTRFLNFKLFNTLFNEFLIKPLKPFNRIFNIGRRKKKEKGEIRE